MCRIKILKLKFTNLGAKSDCQTNTQRVFICCARKQMPMRDCEKRLKNNRKENERKQQKKTDDNAKNNNVNLPINRINLK